MTRNMKLIDKSDARPIIAHIMPWCELGGVEIATLRMAEATSGHFRHVAFCLADADAVSKSFKQLGLDTITYSAPEPSMRHAGKFYNESHILARQLQAAGVDIVHFPDIKAAYHNSLAGFLTNCRMLCHVRSTYTRLSFRERLSLLPIRNFIFVSEESRRRFPLSLPDKSGPVIYDSIDIPAEDAVGCNTAVRHELRIPLEDVVVGMIARINPVKDYFTLAAAAVEILRGYPKTWFLIVGDNSLVEANRKHYGEVIHKLRELGILDKFIFTGHRSDTNRLIAAMDIAVLSTHREGFPLCILEYMAMRRPVVATCVGGIMEVIQDGITGYTYEHENYNELAALIISLIEDPAKAHRTGEAGFENVVLNYSRKTFTEQISKAYTDVSV